MNLFAERGFFLDPPLEACGLRPTEEYGSWPEKLFVEQQDPKDPGNPVNIGKGVKAVNDWTSGWFAYDHYPSSGKVNRESFIESNNHPIRPSTIESAPDREALGLGSHPPAFESEDLIMKAITTGASRELFLNALRSPAEGTHHEIGTEGIMSKKKLNWLWCENGCWSTAYCPHVHRKEFGFDGGDSRRKMVAIPNANHFVSFSKFYTSSLSYS